MCPRFAATSRLCVVFFPSPLVPPLGWQLLLPLPNDSSCPFVLASPIAIVLVALVPLLVVVVVMLNALLASGHVFLYLAPRGPVGVGFPG
jgi:hypothetical protein